MTTMPLAAVTPAPTPSAETPAEIKRKARERQAGQAKSKAQILMLPDIALSAKLNESGGSARALANESFKDLLSLAISSAKLLPGVLASERRALLDMPDAEPEDDPIRRVLASGPSPMREFLAKARAAKPKGPD